jgi:hypothetical protein
MSREDGNHIIFAFVQKRALAETVACLRQFEGAAWVHDLAQKAAAQLVEFEPAPRGVVFTDDLAPVEEMTHRILLQARK